MQRDVYGVCRLVVCCRCPAAPIARSADCRQGIASRTTPITRHPDNARLRITGQLLIEIRAMNDDVGAVLRERHAVAGGVRLRYVVPRGIEV